MRSRYCAQVARRNFIFAVIALFFSGVLSLFASSALAQKSISSVDSAMAAAQSPATNVALDPALSSGLTWRLLGPLRGGRVSAVAGIAGDPATYYMGTPGGGVWKTTDGGHVWKPIFDEEHVASIGAIAIAPSNPNIIYVGTGEQTLGNGVYKSTDAGATWTHVGLDNTQYISFILVDPRNPDIVLVGVLGHPILSVAAPNPEKGVFKSTDGGKTWKKTLYKDALAGVSDLAVDPDNPRVLIAALWHPADWRAGESDGSAPDAWLYKSTDQGSTWKQLPASGLPAEPWGRTGVTVAPGTGGKRLYTVITQGVFRSDDAGATWSQLNHDARVVGNFYFSRIFVDPHDADTVYVMQTTTYRSTDGTRSFVAYKGAPGGDDYHCLWIDPQNSQRMILGVDQGSTISVDGGKSWSSWFNQPTGQFYHIVADDQFPYVVYAPQQDSGTAAVPVRSDYGEITYRDWFSIGGFEYCFIAPDPANPAIVYSGGWYGSVVRFDKNTGQIAHVFVRSSRFRSNQMAPLVFSPQNPRLLYLGTQYLLGTTDSGESWQILSPDLTTAPKDQTAAAEKSSSARPLPLAVATPTEDAVYYPPKDMRNFPTGGNTPLIEGRNDDGDADRGAESDLDAADVDPGASERALNSSAEDDAYDERGPRPPRPATISSVSPSAIAPGVIWVGASNGIIQRTDDNAAHWQYVAPIAPNPQADVSTVEASHFDAASAYASIMWYHDARPYIYRTHDAGKSWQKITRGLPDGWAVYVVREDPVRKNLLYAGTENGVYVSFDDGDHWQSLQLNLPTATVRDLVVHGNDIAVATYGRALWVLDDISPLRQADPRIASSESVHFFQPSKAVRVRWDNDQETPLPPEFPAAKNPPDGAILYYYLKSTPASAITLEIHDAQGRLVRQFSSAPPPPDTTSKNVPDYWFGPLVKLPDAPGLNRFVWDLHYPSPPTLPYSYWGGLANYIEYTLSDHAIPGDTPREQTLGPLASPGRYSLVLTVDGKQYAQQLDLTLDPRVHVDQSALDAQLTAGKSIANGLTVSTKTFYDAAALEIAVLDRQKSLQSDSAPKELVAALKDLSAKLTAVSEGDDKNPGVGPSNRDLARVSFMVQTGDASPSEEARAAYTENCAALNAALTIWRAVNTQTLPPINSQLTKFNLLPLPVSTGIPGSDACAP
ncbi:MAG: hypothetical protein WBZ32_15275 [Candidatus Acidiferrales bacterium]